MPDLLIRNARIIDPTHKGTSTKDLLIQNGRIQKIGKISANKSTKIWDLKGACLSIGWFDIGTQVGDPGLEQNEDLDSVSKAAMAGGFTGIASYPNTKPVVHSKSGVLYLINQTKNNLVEVFPIGAVSHNCEGKDITEMYDMREVGAVAFSDGSHPIQNSGMMMRSLLYVKPFNGVIINQALDYNTAGDGMVHEGTMSTSLGLKGLPSMSEELMVQRDIYLAEYTDSKLHIANISTAGSVRLIRAARKKGIQVTCSVNPANLCLTDEVLEDFDSNYKVMPPLRELSDQKALKKGLSDGVIDVISSNHSPQVAENKNLEFSYADFGMISLETTYSIINEALGKDIEPMGIVEKLAHNPRRILGLEIPKIAVGELANFVAFDPEAEWTFKENDIFSKSKNTPFIGKTMKGRVLGVVNNKKQYWSGWA